jgi:hypothetical protein
MSARDANACHNHPRNHPFRVMQFAWCRFILRAADALVEESINHTMPMVDPAEVAEAMLSLCADVATVQQYRISKSTARYGCLSVS